MQQDINAIIEAVLSRLEAEHQTHAPSPSEDIPAEISARHVHLSREDLLELTGASDLVNSRSISQPGQFLSSLRVRLIGPKGMIDNVAVLGPLRRQTQAEISATDARELGLQAPVRLSGDLKDAAQIHIQTGDRIICRKAAIIAKRHLHAAPGDAQRLGRDRHHAGLTAQRQRRGLIRLVGGLHLRRPGGGHVAVPLRAPAARLSLQLIRIIRHDC